MKYFLNAFQPRDFSQSTFSYVHLDPKLKYLVNMAYTGNNPVPIILLTYIFSRIKIMCIVKSFTVFFYRTAKLLTALGGSSGWDSVWRMMKTIGSNALWSDYGLRGKTESFHYWFLLCVVRWWYVSYFLNHCIIINNKSTTQDCYVLHDTCLFERKSKNVFVNTFK